MTTMYMITTMLLCCIVTLFYKNVLPRAPCFQERFCGPRGGWGSAAHRVVSRDAAPRRYEWRAKTKQQPGNVQSRWESSPYPQNSSPNVDVSDLNLCLIVAGLFAEVRVGYGVRFVVVE